MPLWLNYWYTDINNSRLLKNYIYLLNKREDFLLEDDEKHICRHINDGKLLQMLKSPEYLSDFEEIEVQSIMLKAYPYEVLMKFKNQKIENNIETNEKLIWYFNQFFNINYAEELEKYCNECNREAMKNTYLTHERWRHNDIDIATEQFFDFINKLLLEEWYKNEVEALVKFMKPNLRLNYIKWISGVTWYDWDIISVDVGNNTYTTLFHELIHAVNRFFRIKHYDENIVCYDSLTKTNEWLSNFVAYHLMDAIIAGDIDMIDEMSLDPIFFSMYIDIYATMREHGTNDRTKNFDIIYQELKKFEWDLLTDDKARFYYERFYKFFHYDQHEYFYPKEMMYYLGYNGILELFRNNSNKKQLLANCLLGKVCL